MEYTKVNFNLIKAEEYQIDLLIDVLGSIGFESFDETENGFNAFIQTSEFDEAVLNSTLLEFDEEIEYTFVISAVVPENWNTAWEKNFSPMVVKDQCYVRATFHEPKPTFPYEIIIDPKMAFGTGHHQTTTMMMEYILERDWKGKKVLDMGCGTGILAILAAKRGAAEIIAIDYDPLSYESTLENANLNDQPLIKAICGGKEAIPNEIFDSILANINRNILLDQIPRYAEVLKENASIFFSGFYDEPDMGMILEACKPFKMEYVSHKKLGDWVAMECKKLS